MGWIRLALAGLLVVWEAGPCSGQSATLTLDDLARMGPAELDQLYRNSPAAPVPSGRVRGRALSRPGTAHAVARSRTSRLVWQGKVFHPEESMAVNRFFGIRMIRGRLYYAPSWVDGRTSLILDYQDTSHIYGNYRDEIRQVAPGLYLGLMHARTSPQPTFKLYFALQSP
jgi:hypothetical protein